MIFSSDNPSVLITLQVEVLSAIVLKKVQCISIVLQFRYFYISFFTDAACRFVPPSTESFIAVELQSILLQK